MKIRTVIFGEAPDNPDLPIGVKSVKQFIQWKGVPNALLGDGMEIRVNTRTVDLDYELEEGDTLTIHPSKVEGGN